MGRIVGYLVPKKPAEKKQEAENPAADTSAVESSTRGNPRRCRIMRKIDERLLDPRSEVEIAENFNRVLALVDEASGAEGPAGPQGDPGPKGDPGVGIKTIAGRIDGSNKLTLTITLTDETTQTVEGTITPSAAG